MNNLSIIKSFAGGLVCTNRKCNYRIFFQLWFTTHHLPFWWVIFPWNREIAGFAICLNWNSESRGLVLGHFVFVRDPKNDWTCQEGLEGEKVEIFRKCESWRFFSTKQLKPRLYIKRPPFHVRNHEISPGFRRFECISCFGISLTPLGCRVSRVPIQKP